MGKLRMWAIPGLVALATFLAFLPVLHNGFVAWDDDKNFLANPSYRGLGPDQLRWMWTTFHLGHYVPLSWMTLGLDYVLWGMNPFGYHLTNLLLHVVNAVLVYVLARHLLRGVTPPEQRSDTIDVAASAAIAALLFALHPLRVESVAWITERRDVLSGCFSLLTVLAYLRAIERVETHRRWYAVALGSFACALLSKATSMSVPVVLLILNVYPLGRLGRPTTWTGAGARRVFVELVPFAVLAAGTALLSLVALHPPEQLTAGGKLAASAYSLAFYLWKTLVPIDLSPVYEMPQHLDPARLAFVASYAIVALLFGVLWVIRRRWPGVAAACLAFVVLVLPMLGIVQNGPQIAADRYTYLASPALAILGGAAFLWITRRMRRPWLAGSAATSVLLVLGALTWRQSRVWHDTETLWTQVLRLDDDSSIGHVGMANVLLARGEVDQAIAHATRAIALAPEYAQAHNDLGVGLAREGNLPQASEEYLRALAIEPSNDEARGNLGVVSARLGDYDHAIALFEQALAINPHNADAQVNWGNTLVRLGRPQQAIAHYQRALMIRPDHADAEHNWGVALARQGQLAEAVVHFRRALALDPAHAEARAYLERALRLLHEGAS